MTTNKDNDLREALRRRYAGTPPLPAGFTERLMQRVGDGAAAPSPVPAPRRWRWAAAAAVAVLLLAGGAFLFQLHQAPSSTTSKVFVSEGDELVVIVYGKPVTDHTAVLAEMQKTMAAMTTDATADVVEQQLQEMFGNE